MKKEYFEKSYKNGFLVACMPIDLGYIGFIFQDIPQDEENIEIDELPTRLIIYYPEKNQIGHFGTTRWDKGVGHSFVSANGEISYKDAKENANKSMKKIAPQCSSACIKAQLDKYHKNACNQQGESFKIRAASAKSGKTYKGEKNG